MDRTTERHHVLRTHLAGSLRSSDIGSTVTLTGWVDRRRDHGGVAFADLRDSSGVAQVVIREDVAHELRSEFVLQVMGSVRERPEGNASPNLPPGRSEVVAEDVVVLNHHPRRSPSRFLNTPRKWPRRARLKYRYLDLRRPVQADRMRLRAKVNQAARRVAADDHDFVEIETPTLTRSTPEGARDFIVPARLSPGNWYALPQSPQLFKQLLMVAGMERLLPDRSLLP